MNNFIRKVSITFLLTSTAFTLPGCDNDAGELQVEREEKDFPSFGSIRTNGVSFVVGDVGYIGTGYSSKTGASVKGFWAYNTKTKVWSQMADFPGTGRKDATAFVRRK